MSQSDPGSRAKDCSKTGEDTENVKTEEVEAVITASLYALPEVRKKNKMNLLELEFNNKVDLAALNLTVKDIQKDIKLLDEWGFDFNRNIIQYIHEMAETIRYYIEHPEKN